MPWFRFLLLAGALGCSLASWAQKLSPGEVAVGKLRLPYEARGQGPPVLLLHAGFQDRRMWAAQVKDLARTHRVITLDLPGHGMSSGRDTAVRVGTALAALLDQLAIDRVAVVGLSLGGACAVDFAVSHPGRVSRVVVVSAGAPGLETQVPPDSLTRRYYPELVQQLSRGDTAAAAEVFTRYWCDGPYRPARAVKRSVRRYVYETTLTTMRRQHINGWPRYAPVPAAGRLAELTQPVLLITGDLDLPYIRSAGAFLQRALPNGQLLTIPKVGHMANLEAPTRFNRALREFLGQ